MKWRFFLYSPNNVPYPIVAAKENGGHYFKLNGQDNGFSSSRGIVYCLGNGFKEINLTILKTIVTTSGYKKIIRTLGITSHQKVEVKPSMRADILRILTLNRARNADSAHDFSSNPELADILYTLTEDKVIKTLDGQKYYVEAESERKARENNQLELKMDAKVNDFLEIDMSEPPF